MSCETAANSSVPVGSTEYPARVFFHTPTPETFIDNGYDRVKLQKKVVGGDDFEDVSDIEPEFFRIGTYNYSFVDPFALVGERYRPVIVDGTGVEADIPQPDSPAIDTAYEAVLTVKELKEIYLWGQDPAFVSDVGQYQPDYAFAHSIRYGIGKVETKLSLRLMPTRFPDENHDWMRDGGQANSLIFFADEFPIISVQSLTLRVPGADDFVFPASWLRIDKKSGRIAVVPDSTLPSVGARAFGGLSGIRHLPDAFVLDYFAGYPMETDWSVAAVLKEVVGKEAATGPLNIGGDLVGGAGLAGTSISMDGLSQSVTTTNSSTNAGFGARLIQYEKELRETYKTLLPHFKGVRFRVG